MCRAIDRSVLSAVAVLISLGTAACSGSVQHNDQIIVDNAIDVDEQVVEDADTRADRLDEKSEDLLQQANASGGDRGKALRNEANDDLNAAAAIRSEGQSEGVDDEDRIERAGGLLNRN